MSWWRLLWQQVANPVVALLVGAGLAGAAIGEVVEAIAIGVVLVVNTVVGFLTEFQAARSMAALRDMVKTVATHRGIPPSRCSIGRRWHAC